MKVKVSGPILRSSAGKDLGSSSSSHGVDPELATGDVYVHIHLGWKAFLAFGLLITQFLTDLVATHY